MIKFWQKISRLEIIVFIAGALVMILELIGSRLLAPYLGTSIFVWTALIGIVLGALSLGYYLGGRFSAKNPSLAFLCLILFLAGLAIFLVAIFKDFILFYSTYFGVKSGAVFATIILFALPGVLLGMISPYAVRLKIKDLESSGGIAGNLYALSTIGSIVGTFLAGFYLIPTFGSNQIIFGLAIALILISLLGGRKIFKILILFFTIIIWSFFQFLPTPNIFERDSAYNHLRVVDTIDLTSQQPVRILYLATEAHSIIFKENEELYSKYHQLYLLDSLFKPKIQKALTLGGGAYIAPLNFLKRYSSAEMTVVEIDPAVTAVAKNYFNLKPNPRLKILHQDARIYLNQNKETYDVIYGDAFASYYSIPFQLTTAEAMKKIYDALTPDGILILNVISSIQGKNSLFFQAEYLTLKKIFSQLYLFPARYNTNKDLTQHQNIIIVATKGNNRLAKEQLLKTADLEQKALLDNFWDHEPKIEPGIKILTDDFAPVDYYISKILNN